MAQKTIIPITNGLPKTINWQSDFIYGTTLTYVQKHGNSVDISENDFTDGSWTQNGVPSYTMIKDGFGNIISVTFNPQVEKSEFIII